MSETGVVKFRFETVAIEPEEFPELAELNSCRGELRKATLIGVDRNGIGYGNLSVRCGETHRFYITGSGTSALDHLRPVDCVKVVDFDLEQNWLRSEGLIAASSESLTHAALYEADASVRAIIHCHSAALWQKLRGSVPTTRREIEYGTREIAREVQRLFKETDVMRQKLIVMGGHEDGLIAFGATVREALLAITSAAREYFA